MVSAARRRSTAATSVPWSASRVARRSYSGEELMMVVLVLLFGSGVSRRDEAGDVQEAVVGGVGGRAVGGRLVGDAVGAGGRDGADVGQGRQLARGARLDEQVAHRG